MCLRTYEECVAILQYSKILKLKIKVMPLLDKAF